MPQDVEFDLPFALRISPDLEGTGCRNLRWVQQQKLVAGGQALDWYRSWDIPRLAAYGFPYAQGSSWTCAPTPWRSSSSSMTSSTARWAWPPTRSPVCARA